MFASKSTGGFYDETINSDIPTDAVEISAELYAELRVGHSKGKEIGWGDDGYPILVDPPVPSPEFFAQIERDWRNQQLAATDGIVSRHRDELEEGDETTLTPEQYVELQTYRRALRNWPEAGEFPLIEHRPLPPSWLAAQSQ